MFYRCYFFLYFCHPDSDLPGQMYIKSLVLSLAQKIDSDISTTPPSPNFYEI